MMRAAQQRGAGVRGSPLRTHCLRLQIDGRQHCVPSGSPTSRDTRGGPSQISGDTQAQALILLQGSSR